MNAYALKATSAAGESRVLSAYRAERRKLFAQVSTRALALVCVLGPVAFAIVLSAQSGVPADSLLGVWVHNSGYAVSFVVLDFAGYVGFALLAGVLAGDLFSSEDRYGTWKTVLTRSRTRGDVFAGKLLAAAMLALALVGLLALSSLAAGLVLTGDQPLVGLDGNVIPSGEALWLVLASWLVSIPPVLAFVSIAVLFSVASRSGIVGVLGAVVVALVMQLLALVGRGTWTHQLLVASAFDDWHGLLAAPKFYGQLVIDICIALIWVAGCLAASWAIFRRRDFAGPPVSGRPGWTRPAQAVLGSMAVIVLLGAIASVGPSAITKARLESAVARAFNDLTVLQQRELGRTVPAGTKLNLTTRCGRRSGKSEGPGDDWSCTMTVVSASAGYNPFELTPVTYDVSVKSNGCYKAESPPSFVGRETMVDARGHTVINPLFTIYGCFDVIEGAPRCARTTHCGEAVKPRPSGAVGTRTASPAESQQQQRALREAERAAGPRVMREVEEGEKQLEHETKHPQTEAERAPRTEAPTQTRK
jgi:ABC-2 type transport system permease protein